MSTPDVTVVVATHDLARWGHLVKAVRSVQAQDLPARLVVAVDHNTPLAHRVAAEFPGVQVVENSRARGASGTRNTGAEQADTEILAFLDDDAWAHAGWLRALVAPFADPLVVGTGGAVGAGWAVGRPRWFPEEFDWVVGASDRGLPATTAVVRNVWSENMAIRRSVFDVIGGFRDDFGKIGERSRPEDTDLCIRATRAAHGHWLYVPQAFVEHHVPASRSTIAFFVRRTYLEGRGKVEMARHLGTEEKLDSERRYVRHTLPLGIFAGLRAAARGRLDGLLRAAVIGVGMASAAVGAAAALASRAGVRSVTDG